MVGGKRDVRVNSDYIGNFDKNVMMLRSKRECVLQMAAERYLLDQPTAAELEQIAAAQKAFAAQKTTEAAAKVTAVAKAAKEKSAARSLPASDRAKTAKPSLPKEELSQLGHAAQDLNSQPIIVTPDAFINTMRGVIKSTAVQPIQRKKLNDYFKLARQLGWEIDTPHGKKPLADYARFDAEGNLESISSDRILRRYFVNSYLHKYSDLENFIRDAKPRGRDRERYSATEADMIDLEEYLQRAKARNDQGLNDCVFLNSEGAVVLIRHDMPYVQTLKDNCIRVIPAEEASKYLSNRNAVERSDVSGRDRDVFKIVVRELWLQGPEHLIPNTTHKVGDVIFRGQIHGPVKSLIYIVAEQLEKPQVKAALKALVQSAKEADVTTDNLETDPLNHVSRALAKKSPRRAR
jgi:hypothetical protein